MKEDGRTDNSDNFFEMAKRMRRSLSGRGVINPAEADKMKYIDGLSSVEFKKGLYAVLVASGIAVAPAICGVIEKIVK